MRCQPLDRCECAFYERTTAWVVYWCEQEDMTRDNDDRHLLGLP